MKHSDHLIYIDQPTSEPSSGTRCEEDAEDEDYRPCEEGFYCADDACNLSGEEYDCCKPISGGKESSENITEGIYK